jgi:phosphoribosylanthranilate isomerase
MPRLKICGITDGDFAAEAERLGADYLGFVFAEGSPRRVDAGQVRAIVARLAGKARKVGVYARFPDLAEARSLGLDVIQLHFKATMDEVAKVRAAGFECWALAGGAVADALLFDSSHGDGETRLRPVPCRRILAGKISPENFAAACAAGVDVVDVNSSLETAPGVKSLALLRRLFAQRTDAFSPRSIPD